MKNRTKIHKSGNWDVHGGDANTASIFNQRLQTGIVTKKGSSTMSGKTGNFPTPKNTLAPNTNGLSVNLPNSTYNKTRG